MLRREHATTVLLSPSTQSILREDTGFKHWCLHFCKKHFLKTVTWTILQALQYFRITSYLASHAMKKCPCNMCPCYTKLYHHCWPYCQRNVHFQPFLQYHWYSNWSQTRCHRGTSQRAYTTVYICHAPFTSISVEMTWNFSQILNSNIKIICNNNS